jgi:hypothetical protein
MAARRGPARVLTRATPDGSQEILDIEDVHRPAIGGRGMTQTRITKPRTASRRRRDELEPLDPRDPEIIRAKQLQRRPRQPSATRRTR